MILSDMRAEDVLSLVEEHPCLTIKEYLDLLGWDPIRDHTSGGTSRSRLSKYLHRLMKQGFLEKIQLDGGYAIWRAAGSDAQRLEPMPTYHLEDGERRACKERRERCLEYQGETKLLTEWAEQFGIDPRTVKSRLTRGWDVEVALTHPVSIRRRR